ncbi:MAG: hypothetical protein LQ340_002559 [Diploschistes diacapsis]|nr:MAG: hypothetical protein LQ340_002559 [Diploschistes diacapsis]
MAWYSDEWIRSSVTRDYIFKHLPRNKRQSIAEPLAFGEGLTDLTYGDWIVSKGQRLFSILLDIGCSEHIFGFVDQSVDDSDLPLPREHLHSLGLSYSREKKFYHRQFSYMVQAIQKGGHVDYEEHDVVPLEVLEKSKNNKVDNESFDRVAMGKAELTKWRISLNTRSNEDRWDLIQYYQTLQKLSHPNVFSVFSTYSHSNQGYALLSPCPKLSLKSFLEEPPKSFKEMQKLDQLDQLLQWIRCLIAAVTHLHQNGSAHQAIRPSNIFVTGDNAIALGPHAAIGALEDEVLTRVKEVYQYGAPEQWDKQAPRDDSVPALPSLHIRSASMPYLRHEMKASQPSVSSSRGSHMKHFPPAESPNSRNALLSGERALKGRVQRGTLQTSTSLPSDFPKALTSSRKGSLRTNYHHHDGQISASPGPVRLSNIPATTTPFQSDIFSLCTIIIEVLSLFTSICRASDKYSSSSLHAHLDRNGHSSMSSFHSNLPAIQIWLNGLVRQSEPKDKEKMLKVLTTSLTSGPKSNRPDRDERHLFRYLDVLASFIQLVRHGLNKFPNQRFTADEGLAQADDILQTWGLPMNSCVCFKLTKSRKSRTMAMNPMSSVNPLSTQIQSGFSYPDSSAAPLSPVISNENVQSKATESLLDSDYQLPALTYSPNNFTSTLSFSKLPSRPPTPPPKEPTPSFPLEKKSKSRPRILIAGSGVRSEDTCWLLLTPTSTLFHPTVYELASMAWDSEAENDVHDSPSMQSLDTLVAKEDSTKTTRGKQSLATNREGDNGKKNSRPHKMRSKPRHTESESVIIALDTLELLPSKFANTRRRPHFERGLSSGSNHTHSSHKPILRRSKTLAVPTSKFHQQKAHEGSLTEKRRASSPTPVASSRKERKESIGTRDLIPNGEHWWGLKMGTWKKGQRGWRPVLGGKEDEPRLGRDRRNMGEVARGD